MKKYSWRSTWLGCADMPLELEPESCRPLVWDILGPGTLKYLELIHLIIFALRH